MTFADIPLASGLKRLVDCYVEQVRSALARFRRGGDYANAPVCLSLPLLRRLEKLLRLALLIVATQIELKPTKVRPIQVKTAHGDRRPPRGAHMCAPGLRVFPVYRRLVDVEAPKNLVPPGFAKAERDPFLTIQRKLDALCRAMMDPAPLVRRMARRLPTRLLIFGWRPPKRPPPRIDRDIFDSLVEGYCEARFQLSEFHRRRREKEAFAAAS